ncbi:MAG: CO/xanthine dehydrogenase FAD-binding subunit [Pseudorhodobacter sp.]|jgi:CO/xanthine dehydrogenase FAD-binding subunit
MTAFLRPSTLSEAFAALANGPARLLAGGTDLYPATQAAQLSGDIIDLTAVGDLSKIVMTDAGLSIGACTNWATIAEAKLPAALTALQQAAREVGGRQIQNAGTLGGNLCNASPAADGVPPLLIMDAQVRLTSASGARLMPLASFLIGPRQTALQLGEILTEVFIPQHSLSGQSKFLKLGARAYLVISIAMVAVRLTQAQGRISGAAMAVGACSATARRLPELERELVGAKLAQAAARVHHDQVAPFLSPLDDLRATASYRAEAATELLRRAVADCCEGLAE